MSKLKSISGGKADFPYAAPAAGRFFVIFEEPETIRNGVIIPDLSQKYKDEATVVAVGPGYYDQYGNFKECPCKPGDRIWLNANAINDEKRYRDETGAVKTIAAFTFNQCMGTILQPENSVYA